MTERFYDRLALYSERIGDWLSAPWFRLALWSSRRWVVRHFGEEGRR